MGFLSSIVGRLGIASKEGDLKIGPKLSSEIPDRLGPKGETLAAQYLEQQGYKILQKNFRVKPGEIDIIAQEGETLCFVEVKARRGERYGSGLEAISTLKKRKLCQAALMYLTQNHLVDMDTRFDVVSIFITEGDRCEFELIKNAFEITEGLF